MEHETRVVLGIGVNLKTGNNDIDVEVAALDELVNIEHQEFDRRLNCELASLIESQNDIPPIRFSEIRMEVTEQMKAMGRPQYKGEIFEQFSLNERGELILGKHIVDDGEFVVWT